MHSVRLRRAWLTACAVACVMGTGAARADLVFSMTPGSAGAGGSGSFDVVLTDTGGGFNVAGFNFEITTSNTDVTFTDITINTVAAPYVFAGDSLLAAPVTGSILENPPSTAQDAQAGDVTADFTAVAIADGDEVGLGHVLFTIAPGSSPGPVSIDFGSATSLSDDLGNPIEFDSSGGTLTITGGTVATPEPAMTGVLGLALAGIVLVRRKMQLRVQPGA
jgi:hypothetical protein